MTKLSKAESRVDIGLPFVRSTQTRLQNGANVALYVLDVQLGLTFTITNVQSYAVIRLSAYKNDCSFKLL